MNATTRLVRYDAAPDDPFRPSCTPLHLTATFVQESPECGGPYDYSRSGNPTRDVLERQLAGMEGGSCALAYSSGLAALAAVSGLLHSGDEVLAGSDLYGGTVRLLAQVLPRRGIVSRYADATDTIGFARAMSSTTRLILLETPSNPLLRIVDLRSLRAAVEGRAAELGIERPILCVDNTLMSPYLQSPLELGADLVVHSATKGLSGHGDVTAGAVVTRDESLAEQLAFLRNAEGNALAPFDAWLLLRGMKTLAVRLDRQQETAGRVARALQHAPGVRRVHWPGLSDHPGAAAHARQARGPGAVVSVELESVPLAREVAASLELFPLTVSFGSVGSSACLPVAMSHASIPPALASLAPPATLLRLSIGLEDADDLVQDFIRAVTRSLCGLSVECT